MLKRLLTILKHFEYWPMWMIYTPLFFYFLMKGLYRGHLFYFTTVNRGFDAYGGLFFDSKIEVDSFIPERYKVKSHLVSIGQYESRQHTRFPVYIKPDQGEKGRGVRKINTQKELNDAFKSQKETLIIQEYIDLPIEFAVFICFVPKLNSFKILSITEKEFFNVMGDSELNIDNLIKNTKTGMVLYDEIINLSTYDLNYIPKNGEKCVIHQIGNHSKGCQFRDASDLINPEMETAFNNLLYEIKAFEYGRFDLKVAKIEDLYSLNGVKFIEFNGLAAEPTIMYDARNGYFWALKTYVKHWQYLDKLALYKKELGIKPMPIVKILGRIV